MVAGVHLQALTWAQPVEARASAGERATLEAVGDYAGAAAVGSAWDDGFAVDFAWDDGFAGDSA